MSDPNMTTVYDKNGEPFETSRANARDLVTHAGWSFARPTVIEKIVEVQPTPVPTPIVEETAAAPVFEEETAAAEDFDAATATGVELFTTVEQFADLDREGVVVYLADNFPDFQPHHRAGRDKLVEEAIKLAGE